MAVRVCSAIERIIEVESQTRADMHVLPASELVHDPVSGASWAVLDEALA